jgi:hypothetical protein
MTDFFISYNKADRTWAEWIAWQLEEADYTIVIQAWDFRPGSNFVLNMQRAATSAQRIIAVLSPDYLTAQFTQSEWAVAFANDPHGVNGLLLPVRVRECELTGLLSQVIYIDLVGLDEATAKNALLVGINRTRVKPSVPPGFPGIASTKHVVPTRPSFPPTDDASMSTSPTTSYIDQRQGTFINGGTIYGPVVGNSSGIIETTYSTTQPSSSNIPSSTNDSMVVDKIVLRNFLIQKFSEDELHLLCSDVEEALKRDGIQEQINLEMVGGTSKPSKVLNLIQHLDRRGYLQYLIGAVRQIRPGRI